MVSVDRRRVPVGSPGVRNAKQRVVEVKARPAAKTYDLNDDDESEDDDGLGFDAKQDDGGFSPERNKVFVSRGGR